MYGIIGHCQYIYIYTVLVYINNLFYDLFLIFYVVSNFVHSCCYQGRYWYQWHVHYVYVMRIDISIICISFVLLVSTAIAVFVFHAYYLYFYLLRLFLILKNSSIISRI